MSTSNDVVDALVVTTDGTQELISIKADGTGRELQSAVGGYIESIMSTDGFIVYANEDGQRLNLKHNPKGSALVSAVCETSGRSIPWGADELVGNIVIVGHDGSGENVPIPDEWVDRFKAMGLWV